ncbi:lipase 3 isoform X1 [Leptinotarsa decemlineata]|uniref:lipase 3 isoform X1 n=1 Tax=Leptinotarsa decemlineata TaxID=7539 RepID=UPI003D308EAD
MAQKFWIIILLCHLPQKSSATENRYTEMNIIEQVEKYGYPIEEHEVQTHDDYLLTVFRIPHGTNESFLPNRTAVLINHGLFGSAENFVMLGPNKSLAYMLADNGYDVWLMNSRGTWHSRKHKTMNPDEDRTYWKFTWHEIGVFDIPAIIDYILDLTKHNAIHYVGHSQGATSLFVMGSEKRHYNKKIKLMIAMAPAAIFRNVKIPILKILATFYKTLQILADRINILEFPPPFFSAEMIRHILGEICSLNTMLLNFCKFFIDVFNGDKEELLDLDSLPSLFTAIPAGCSTKQLWHFAQLIESGNFETFDWGEKENIKKYGTKTPSSYDFRKITFPVALIFGRNDMIVTKEDVKIVSRLLPNVIADYEVPDDRFGHLDFVMAKNVDVVLNRKVIKLLKKYD